MPEQITKHPDATLQLLKAAGAVCGQGAQQKVLTQCPKERFCALPTGEVCIYGIDQIAQMTQITTQELAQVIAPHSQQATQKSTEISTMEAVAVLAVFVAGIALGRYWPRARMGS